VDLKFKVKYELDWSTFNWDLATTNK
jgi:hypothetical protein